MRGSVCAYWLRLGLLLVCRSLRLSVAGWLGVCVVCVALLRFRRRMDFRTELGSTGWSDQQWLPSVWIHRWLSACGQWLDGFPGCSRARVPGHLCVCVSSGAGWISGQWMHARMDVHGLLLGYVARALCVLVCRALALVACVRVG